MPTDAHCHPRDLLKRFPQGETARRNQGVVCAASAWNKADFTFHEELARQARQDQAPGILLCFGVHPQLPAAAPALETSELLAFMETLAEQGRLEGVGETGFDLYNSAFRNTEGIQEELFMAHWELALKKELPLVLHIRKAMHKIFSQVKTLKKIPALIFHSYPGTLGEGEALLRRGINAYFSFGNPVVLGRKETLRSCRGLPLDRLLVETDAPYQHPAGRDFSHWGDLGLILQRIAQVREEGDLGKLQGILDENFYRAYGKYPHA